MIAPFQRTRLTWFLYLLLGWYAYLQAGINPIMPLLRRDLDLTYAVGGLHASAFALGMVIAGIVADRMAQRWGVISIMWAGTLGLIAGALLLIVGKTAWVTISGAFLIGWLGSCLQVMVQTMLIHQHTVHSPIALTESNITASLTASIIPIVVGVLEGAGFGWQWAYIIGIVLWVGFWVSRKSITFPEINYKTNHNETAQPLSFLFWLYCFVVFLGVSVEWCVWLWGADYFILQAKLDPATAAGLVTFFTIGAVSGRLISSRLLRRLKPFQLMPTALLIVLLGFPFFWLGTFAPINVFGIFLLGFGAGGLFPLALGAAVGAAGLQSSKASARVTLVAGAAILINPPILGVIADRVGMQSAYTIVIVLTVIALLVTLWANRLMTRQLSPSLG